MTELRKFKIKLASKGLTKEYTMSECLWIDDMSLQQQCIDKNGNLNLRELWIKRLTAALNLPENEIRKLANWELSSLTERWLDINQADTAIFLEDSPKDEKASQSNTTS